MDAVHRWAGRLAKFPTTTSCDDYSEVQQCAIKSLVSGTLFINKLFVVGQMPVVRGVLQQLNWLDVGRMLAVYENADLLQYIISDTALMERIFLHNSGNLTAPRIHWLDLYHPYHSEIMVFRPFFDLSISKRTLENITTGEDLLFQYFDMIGNPHLNKCQIVLSVPTHVATAEWRSTTCIAYNPVHQHVVAIAAQSNSISFHNLYGRYRYINGHHLFTHHFIRPSLTDQDDDWRIISSSWSPGGTYLMVQHSRSDIRLKAGCNSIRLDKNISPTLTSFITTTKTAPFHGQHEIIS